MALTLIGQDTIRVGDGWVPYSSISLSPGNTFVLEIFTTSPDPTLIYSRFLVGYTYPTQSSPTSFNLNRIEFFYEPISQHAQITVPSLLAPGGQLQFRVRRIPLYSSYTNLSDVDVSLAYDPVIVT